MVQGSWVGGRQVAGMESGPGNGNGILIQQSSLSLPDRTVPYMALSVRLAELLACTYTGAG